MTLEDFNKNYIYVSDIVNHKRVEHWTVISPDPDGKYRGDCEDYLLTLIDKVDGFHRLELWYCKLNGEGHCIGRLPGPYCPTRGIYGMWIDCNTKKLVRSLPFNFTEKRKFSWFKVFVKRLSAYFLRSMKAVLH